MEKSEIIQILCDPSARSHIHQHAKIETKFDFSSDDYLRFAEEDLIKNEPRCVVNALSNAKRAIDSRIDTLLIGLTYYKRAQKKYWGIPDKLKKIADFGIITPRVILKLNKKRNLLEHQFKAPDYEEVEDFIDIASLFLHATETLVYQFPVGGVIVSDSCDQYSGQYIKLDYQNEKLILHERFFMSDLGGFEDDDNPWADHIKSRKVYTITQSDSDFDKLLKCYIKACTRVKKD